MLQKRAEDVSNFFENTATSIANTFQDAIVGQNAATTIAYFASQLIAGGDIKVIAQNYANMLVADAAAKTLLDQILSTVDISGYLHAETGGLVIDNFNETWTVSNNGTSRTYTKVEAQDMMRNNIAYRGILLFATNGIISGNWTQAAQNTSIQLVVQAGIKAAGKGYV